MQGWTRNDKAAVVYSNPADPTQALVVFPNALGVSLDGETQADGYAILLEMGGKGGWDVVQEGIASDFIDDWVNVKELTALSETLEPNQLTATPSLGSTL